VLLRHVQLTAPLLLHKPRNRFASVARVCQRQLAFLVFVSILGDVVRAVVGSGGSSPEILGALPPSASSGPYQDFILTEAKGYTGGLGAEPPAGGSLGAEPPVGVPPAGSRGRAPGRS